MIMRQIAAVFGALIGFMQGATVNAAEIKILCTTALFTALEELAPQFERASGHKLVMSFANAASMTKRIADGEAADVAIITGAGVDDLIKQGKMASGTRVDIARSNVGVAVRAGAPKPDISTPDALKRTLLNAQSIAASSPTGGGASGALVAAVLVRLGIADQVKPKMKYAAGGPGGLVGTLVAKGEAEIGLQQVSELMAAPGVDIVGSLPAVLETATQFSAGIPASAKAAEAGKALVTFLTTPAAAAVIKAKGLEPS
jgi:molybdate transport system substrate-binding protein